MYIYNILSSYNRPDEDKHDSDPFNPESVIIDSPAISAVSSKVIEMLPDNLEPVFMTIGTWKRLYRKRQVLEAKIIAAGIAAGQAASDDTWHDNAEYDEQTRIRQILSIEAGSIQDILDATIIIEGVDGDVVGFGTEVNLTFLDELDTATYQILSRVDADPRNGIISYGNPLAQAIIGRSAGEVAEVRAPDYTYNVLINSVTAIDLNGAAEEKSE